MRVENIFYSFFLFNYVAEMIGKAHKTLMRDIRKHIDNMGTDVFQSNFFIESTYQGNIFYYFLYLVIERWKNNAMQKYKNKGGNEKCVKKIY